MDKLTKFTLIFALLFLILIIVIGKSYRPITIQKEKNLPFKPHLSKGKSVDIQEKPVQKDIIAVEKAEFEATMENDDYPLEEYPSDYISRQYLESDNVIGNLPTDDLSEEPLSPEESSENQYPY